MGEGKQGSHSPPSAENNRAPEWCPVGAQHMEQVNKSEAKSISEGWENFQDF